MIKGLVNQMKNTGIQTHGVQWNVLKNILRKLLGKIQDHSVKSSCEVGIENEIQIMYNLNNTMVITLNIPEVKLN
jgi:hypothetical protein